MNDDEKQPTVAIIGNEGRASEMAKQLMEITAKSNVRIVVAKAPKVGEENETREINLVGEGEGLQQKDSDLIVGIDTAEGRDRTGAIVIRDGKVVQSVQSDELWHGDEGLANLVQSGQLNCDEELMQILSSPRPRPPGFPDDIQVRKPHRGQTRVLSRKRGKRVWKR